MDTPPTSPAGPAPRKKPRRRLLALAACLAAAAAVWAATQRDAARRTLHRWSVRWCQRAALRRILAEHALPSCVRYEHGRLVRTRDGAEMALIPAGEFLMGGDWDEDERPKHRVYLDAYLIDKFEVTNAQFKRFIEAHPEWSPRRVRREGRFATYLKHWRGGAFPPGRGRCPVHHVPWEAAHAYAMWVGADLPTEAQWEKAARGGWTGRPFPWGERRDPAMADWGRPRWPHLKPGKPVSKNDFLDIRVHNPGPSPVGAFPANAYGLHDMAGNVWEWCRDWYDPTYYRSSPRRNPTGPPGPVRFRFLTWDLFVTARCARGGSWYRRPTLCRCGNRSFDHYQAPIAGLTEYYYGFRCAADLAGAGAPGRR